MNDFTPKKTTKKNTPNKKSRGLRVVKEVIIMFLLSKKTLPIKRKAIIVTGIPRKARESCCIRFILSLKTNWEIIV